MSNPSWTMGPWRCGPNTLDRHRIISAGDETVAVCSFPDEGDDTANAHMMAAAPELYGALLGLQSFCDDPNGSEKSETLTMGLARLLPAARAALARARGEQS